MQNYHLYDEIGRGRNSVVYKGREKKTVEYVAIKSVDKACKARVLNEVSVMYTMDHSHILKFKNWYETSNHIWLIVEYCAGGSLLKALKEDTKLPESSVKAFGRDILAGLQYVHHMGFIFGDLKPSNILLNEYGVLKLSDFGLACPIPEDPALSGSKKGSPHYMAPELFQAEGIRSRASDFWAFGCIIYELFTGYPPFNVRNVPALIKTIVSDPYEDLPTSTSPELVDLIRGCLNKDDTQRIAWHDMLQHPFWAGVEPITALEMPPELLWNKIRRRTSRQVNIMHLSMTAAAHSRADAENEIENEGETVLDDHSNMRVAGKPIHASRAMHSNTEMGPSCASLALVESQVSSAANFNVELDFTEPASQSNSAVSRPQSTDKDDEGETENAEEIDQLTTGAMGLTLTFTSRAHAAAIADAAKVVREEQACSSDHEVLASNRSPLVCDQGPKSLKVTSSRFNTPCAEQGLGKPALSFQDSPPAIAMIESALFTQADLVVKPLVDNIKIEKILEPKVKVDAAGNVRFISVKAWPLHGLVEMLATDSNRLEAFLVEVYKACTGNSKLPNAHRLAALEYVQTIVVDTQLANIIINSSLMSVFVKMVAVFKSSALKAQLLIVIALLLRHATDISIDLSDTGIVQILTDALRDKNIQIRRRASCALGELLFYIATQTQLEAGSDAPFPDGQHGPWPVPPITIKLILRSLRPGEDDIVRHYAVQTIGNICAQCPAHSIWFTSQDHFLNLMAIFCTTKTLDLRTSSAAAVSLLLFREPSLVIKFLDKFGLELIVDSLLQPSIKLQQIFLNILNMVLCKHTFRVKSQLVKFPGLLPYLLRLLGLREADLEARRPLVTQALRSVLQGKAVLTVALLSTIDVRWFVKMCAHEKTGLASLIDRLPQDSPYLSQCVDYLSMVVPSLAKSLLTQTTNVLSRLSSRKNSTPELLKEIKNIASTYSVTWYALGSSVLRPAMLGTSLPYHLVARHLHLVTITEANFAEKVQLQDSILSVLDIFVYQPEIFESFSVGAVVDLIKALVLMVKDASSETRFAGLRVLCDIVVQLLRQESLYDPKEPVELKQESASTTNVINNILLTDLLPLCPHLMRDQHPLPQYTSKLLAGLVTQNRSFIPIVFPLFDQVFEFFQPEHTNNNLHIALLVLAGIRCPLIDTGNLVSLGIVAKVNAMMLDVGKTTDKQPFLKPVLDIMYELLVRAAAADRSVLGRDTPRADGVQDDREEEGKDVIGLIEPVVSNLDSLIALLISSATWQVKERAAKCLYAICRVYPRFHDSAFTHRNLKQLESALSSSIQELQSLISSSTRPNSAAATQPAQIAIHGTQLAILKMVLIVCKTDREHASVVADSASQIFSVIVQLSSAPSPCIVSSSGPTVQTLATEIRKVVTRNKF